MYRSSVQRDVNYQELVVTISVSMVGILLCVFGPDIVDMFKHLFKERITLV